MNLWYSSDLHLGHARIIEHCNRPFKDAHEMDEALIENHNALVKPEDNWWNLGDVTMARGSVNSAQARRFVALVKRFNGHKRLILGNHDHFPVQVYIDAGFEKIQAQHMHDGLLFMHYPVHPASVGRAKAVVHGHIHNNQAEMYPPVKRFDGTGDKVPYINISVEVTEYKPVSLEWLKERVDVR